MTLCRCTTVALVLALCLAIATQAATPADLGAGSEASASVPTATASACPTTIRLGTRRFAYFQKNVNCTRARRAVQRLYATYGREGRPRGFRCRSPNRFRRNGACKKSSSVYFVFSL